MVWHEVDEWTRDESWHWHWHRSSRSNGAVECEGDGEGDGFQLHGQTFRCLDTDEVTVYDNGLMVHVVGRDVTYSWYVTLVRHLQRILQGEVVWWTEREGGASWVGSSGRRCHAVFEGVRGDVGETTRGGDR